MASFVHQGHSPAQQRQAGHQPDKCHAAGPENAAQFGCCSDTICAIGQMIERPQAYDRVEAAVWKY
jgi:hypothetical protein